MIYRTLKCAFCIILLTFLVACSENDPSPIVEETIMEKLPEFEPLTVSENQSVMIDLSNLKKEEIHEVEYKFTFEQLFVKFKEGVAFEKFENNGEQNFEVSSQSNNHLTLKSKRILSSWEEVQERVEEAIGKENIAYIHPYLKTEEGKLLTYLNEVGVKINEDFSEEELEALLGKLAIKPKKIIPNAYFGRTYIIQLENEEAPNAIPIAKQLLQTGYFEFSSPQTYELADLL